LLLTLLLSSYFPAVLLVDGILFAALCIVVLRRASSSEGAT
jgi:hypothetical protein